MNTRRKPNLDHKLTKLDGAILPNEMTFKQALAFGRRHMRRDLREAGFTAAVYVATVDVNGWDGYNINFGKRVAA